MRLEQWYATREVVCDSEVTWLGLFTICVMMTLNDRSGTLLPHASELLSIATEMH
jgi:hypothetical protein